MLPLKRPFSSTEERSNNTEETNVSEKAINKRVRFSQKVSYENYLRLPSTVISTTTSHADALPFIHTFASENATNANEEETATGLAEDVENTKKYKLLTSEDFQALPETTPKGSVAIRNNLGNF